MQTVPGSLSFLSRFGHEAEIDKSTPAETEAMPRVAKGMSTPLAHEEQCLPCSNIISENPMRQF